MSEQQTSTPEAETPAPTNNNNNTSRNTNNNNRRRPNNRNNNLASMPNAERNFKGKIEELPIIGKPYEQTDTYEKLIDATVDYSIINLDEGDDITKLLEKGEGDFLKSSGMTEPTITTAEEALKSKVYVYQKKMDIYMRREHLFEQNKKRVFTIMLGQCTPSLLTSVKSSDNWTAKNEEKDPIWLMGQLKKLTVGIDDFQNDLVTAHDALTRVYRMYQRPLKTNDQYMERYKEYWATCASAAGENCLVPEIAKTGKYSSMNDEKWNEATKAMYFFLHADKICFGDKIREIQENVVLGTDSFPTTLDAAYRILSDTQSRLNQDRVRRGGGYDRRITGYSNYQGRGNRENQPTIPEGANIVIGTDRQVYTIQCNRCNEWGHYADKCPEAPDQENTAANILAFHTLSALDDAYMVYDSRVADCFRLIYRDGREMQFQNFGDGLYTYVDPKDNWKIGPKQKKSFAQYLQTVNDKEQLMTKKEIERAQRAVEVQEFLSIPSVEEFLQIVRGNEGRNIDVTVDDIKRAVHLYGIPTPYLCGRATRRRPLKHDPLENLKEPLPVELHDKRLELYIDIFKFAGVYFLLMESSRVKYVSIEDIESQTMTALIPLVQAEIDMYAARGLQITGVHVDNQFFNEQFAQSIKPATLIPYAANEHVSVAERRNRTIQERMRSLLAGLPYKSIPKIMVRGLGKKVKVINQFPVRTGGVSLTISPEEIVEGRRKLDFSKRRINFGQYAEIHDGTTNIVKERTVEGIAMYPTNDQEGFAFMCLKTGKYRHSNNWTQLPITAEVIQRVETIAKDIVNVNTFMEEIDDYVNDEIMKGAIRQEDLLNNDTNNENEESSESESDSSDDENEQEIREEQPREINGIPVVEDVESSDEENEINIVEPQVRDLQRVDIISETSSEGDFDSISESEDEIPRKMSEDEIMNTLHYDVDGPTDMVDRQRFEEACQQARVMDRDEKVEETAKPQAKRRQQPRRNVRTRDEYRRDIVEGRKKAKNNYQDEINIGTQYFQKIGGKWSKGFRNLRSKYADAASFLAQKIEPEMKASKETISEFSVCVNTCFTQQMSVNKGFQKFGEVAVAAMIKELKQLDKGAVPNKPVIEPIDYDSLNYDERKKALDAVNMIELKRDGRVKGRSCANGSKQRSYLTEYESVASPTVSLEGMMSTLLIGAYEGREHISFDVPGAFLQAEMSEDKLVLLKFRGSMAEMMCEVNPEYKQHLRKENGETVLYCKVKRAIYGCIESALQWYKLFAGTLKDLGFVLNPYDKFVANKMVNGKQLTIDRD